MGLNRKGGIGLMGALMGSAMALAFGAAGAPSVKVKESEEQRQIREARQKRDARKQKEADLRTQALQELDEGVSRQARRYAQRKLDKASRKRQERIQGKR